MRAIIHDTFGGPEVLRLEEHPDPEPGPGQVRIRVAASGVHLLDVSIRSGTGFGMGPEPELPMIPGREVAGVVDAVGEGSEDWLHRRVVVHLGPAGRGGYATAVVADAPRLHELPPGLDAAVAVAAIGTGRTALALLDQISLGADDTVLVTSAAGGLGLLFLQHLRSVGAASVALVGGPAKARVALAHGASQAVDYLDPAWPRRARAAVGAATVLLDGVGGEVAESAAGLLVPGGRVLSFGWSSGRQATWPDHVVVDSPLGPRLLARPGGLRSLEEDALAAAADGTRVPVVGARYPLADAADAHRDLEERRTHGKVVLEPLALSRT